MKWGGEKEKMRILFLFFDRTVLAFLSNDTETFLIKKGLQTSSNLGFDSEKNKFAILPID